MPDPQTPPHPAFLEAFRVWVKIGLLSFGGPAGQIALMHRELVERRRWISDKRFLHALNYCMLLPGPEAQQLAVYTGWLLHGKRGGIVAGALFVLPGALLMLGICFVYVHFGKIPWVDALFHGLKAAVMAIVAGAVLRIGRKILKNPVMWGISAVSFAAIFFAGVPFPAIVLGALAVGLIFGKRFPEFFGVASGHGGGSSGPEEGYVISDRSPAALQAPGAKRTLMEAVGWIAVWLAPLAVCLGLLGPGNVLTKEGFFFAKAALLTFGGAYAVLPYVGQQAVETHGWLSATQMMDGLGLAETTPGPLILVLQFVGFLGGWNAPGTLGPALNAVLASGLTTWMTFVPGYLFIFAGAPFIERTRGNSHLNTALSAVTAAVVGVILNLAVWFGIHLVVPDPETFDGIPLVLAAVFFLLMQKWKWDVLHIVAAGAVTGLLLHLAGLR